LKDHRYDIQTRWTGNQGSGTSNYYAYKRDFEVTAPGKAEPILGSSDPHFRGDPERYNPEELLVASLSTCHMLWMLHLCAKAGIVITAYSDEAYGVMRENEDGSGEFVSVTLKPWITITDGARVAETIDLNHQAHELCFIARSINFPVRVEPAVDVR
jgi:organic hydroperoxide reductase OsmC/OhrA